MNKQMILGLAIGVILILIGALYVAKNQDTSTKGYDNSINENRGTVKVENSVVSTTESQSAEPTENIVTNVPETSLIISYSDNTFSPKSLKLKLTDTLKFENKSSARISIFSTPYPSNTDSPFLNIGIIEPLKKSFKIKFEKSGIYKFYEIKSPDKYFEIVVE